MKVDIYRSASDPDLFMTVPAGYRTILRTSVPLDYEVVNTHLLGEDIQPGDVRAGFNAAAVIADIDRHGLALHSAKLTVERL